MKPGLIIQFSFFIVLTLSCSTTNTQTGSPGQTNGETTSIRSDFKKYFDDCKVAGSIAIYDYNNRVWYLSDTADVKKESLPASTFKIINLLIALETGTIKDENEIVPWPGLTDTIKYGFRPNIYHDMSVQEAFEVSAGWVFVELAKKIGKANYQKYLTRCNYGNGDLSEQDPDFWNFGHFGISPINQVNFVRKLYEGSLPFSKKNMEIVKKVMLTEQTKGFAIRAKTGWTREGGINTGWWTGYLETEKGVYFYATRLLQDRKMNGADFGTCRKEITKAAFRDLNIIK